MNTTNKVLITICILLIFTLSACKKTEQSHKEINSENEQRTISYSFKNPNTEQEFNIIHAYLLYENYFETVKDNPDESHYKLYKEEIIKPVYEACFKDAEIRVNVLEWTPKESNFDSIENQIESMNTDHLNKVFEESLIKSSDILSSDKKTTVCIFPRLERFPSDMMTIGAGKIIVSYRKFDNSYKPNMAHEYHHSVWFRKHYTENYNLTGLDHLILEGRAVMFETLVYPDLNSSYYVDESFNKEYWSKIQSYLESTATREIDEMKFGGSSGLPNNYGYSEGYKMIRSYLNLHPNMTVEEWTSKSSKEIFEEGNYIANYE
ncbi:DUF2268 domain-containing putative Zn-dependent protease [Sporosarcina sp. FSL K6-2383]|uniref:DUF2268 domain-containing putative Zn-dependent protease n=1 Tax=Sporosarcina sp. FSL K6-2383 TaxID=2921556 RepID=UPI00315B0112